MCVCVKLWQAKVCASGILRICIQGVPWLIGCRVDLEVVEAQEQMLNIEVMLNRKKV